MKILVALDTKKYSQKILKDVARLAKNTLADIVFLGIQDGGEEPKESLVNALVKYQSDVYSYFATDDLPYAAVSATAWQAKGKGDWSLSAKGLKEFTLRIKTGSVAKQAVSVAAEMQCDLIVLGCSCTTGCEWDGEMNVPLRIAEDAPCSVMVVKQVNAAKEIISILDRSVVNQEALEMVNQLVTLYGASLKIVGVKEKKERKQGEIEQRMVELLRYYNDREVNAWVKLLDSDDVKDYVTHSSQKAVIALWMGGKQTLVTRIFTRSMVDNLLETSKSSLLILR